MVEWGNRHDGFTITWGSANSHGIPYAGGFRYDVHGFFLDVTRLGARVENPIRAGIYRRLSATCASRPSFPREGEDHIA